MNFPYIEKISDILPAIEGRDEFKVVVKGEYTVINYVVAFDDTFPAIEFAFDRVAMLRRECRGIIFDTDTGEIIRRPYHKFFNMNEKEEFSEKNLLARDDWQTAKVLEKLDGSMIVPFRTSRQKSMDGFRFHVGTKMGVTDVSENAKRFIDNHPAYQEVIQNCLENDWSPIFEWCSLKNQIVVEYPEDRLVLTAIRDIKSGRYFQHESIVSFAETYGIDYVMIASNSVLEAKESLSDLQHSEGYVVRFENGDMVKLKGSWYLQLHKTMEHLLNEKDVIRLIIENKLDDARPFLPKSLVEKTDAFAKDIFKNINDFASSIFWEALAKIDHSKSKKDFAEYVKGVPHSDIRFKVFDWIIENYDDKNLVENGLNKTSELVINKVSSNLSTQTKVEGIRNIIKAKWEI